MEVKTHVNIVRFITQLQRLEDDWAGLIDDSVNSPGFTMKQFKKPFSRRCLCCNHKLQPHAAFYWFTHRGRGASENSLHKGDILVHKSCITEFFRDPAVEAHLYFTGVL